ncbi:MAG: acyl CoA:acetate/3-ketoacid CoA transferase [Bauldia sp.]|nr:acyl CoA:acetate/3-ketoacid CoA transferase [Bauldia sp.]
MALTGSGIFLEADAILAAIEKRFLATGHPRDLTVVHALGIGDGVDSGLSRLAHEGLVRKVIGGHWSWSPRMQRLARENRIAAYSFPGGVISSLLREIGAGRPGLITRIGLGTFADPRVDGGRCNARADEDLVEVVEFDGKAYLRYKPFNVDCAVVRGSEADRRGNISLMREPADLDVYAVALAARNCGGAVYAQVEKLVERRAISARLYRLPGVLVDAVAVAPDARRTYLPGYDPHISGEAAPAEAGEAPPAIPDGLRRIIAERAAKEIDRPMSVNFGYGIPGGIPALLRAAGAPAYWGTVEQGIHNGANLDGPMFGAARDPDAILSSVEQFDFYSGGGIDIAFLGMGEMDADGNVNVSMINGMLVGPGGFVDITQTAKKVVFCGAFEAKGLEVDVGPDGKVRIRAPGSVPKFVERVEHITFSGRQARRNGQTVLYITERAVFRLGPEDVELIELAPGIDLERDVLERMMFRPAIRLAEAASRLDQAPDRLKVEL